MKEVIIDLKQRIEENFQALHNEHGEKCQLATSILEMINLFLSIDASDEQIQIYLTKVDSAIKLLEEKLKKIEKRKKVAYPL